MQINLIGILWLGSAYECDCIMQGHDCQSEKHVLSELGFAKTHICLHNFSILENFHDG